LDATCAPIQGTALNGAIAAHTAVMDAAPTANRAALLCSDPGVRVEASHLSLTAAYAAHSAAHMAPTGMFLAAACAKMAVRATADAGDASETHVATAAGASAVDIKMDGAAGNPHTPAPADMARPYATLAGAVVLSAVRAASAGAAPIAPLKARCAAVLHAT